MGNQEAAMKFFKTSGLLMLVVILVCALSGPATAQLFKKPQQFVNVGIAVDDGTIAPTDVWSSKLPNLTTQNFAIPSKKYVAFTSISMRFIPNPAAGGSYRLIFADQLPAPGVTPIVYYGLSLSNSFAPDGTTFRYASNNSDFNPCLLFSKMPAVYVINVTDPTQPNSGDAVAGVLRITMLGYTAP
jgi:hypothetical protein